MAFRLPKLRINDHKCAHITHVSVIYDHSIAGTFALAQVVTFEPGIKNKK